MEITFIICILIVTTVKEGDCASNLPKSTTAVPIYIWPLNKDFRGIEAKTATFSMDPQRDKTLSVNPNGNPFLNDRSTLIFNGNDFIDVPISGDTQFESVAFSVFVKPAHGSKARSVFLHYKANVNDPTKISEFLLEGKSEDTFVTITFGNGQQKKIDCPNDFYKSSEIYLATLTQAFSLAKAVMHFNIGTNDVHAHKETTAAKRLNVPGILRFGGHQSNPGLGFVGELSCAAMFQIEKYIDPSHYASLCNSVQLPLYDPSLIWPLDENTFGQEVLQNVSAMTTGHELDAIFLDGPTPLPNKAYRFDGSHLSYIQTRIPLASFLQKPFSIAMYIYLDEYSDGVIFTSSAEATGLNKMKLTSFNNQITFHLYDNQKLSPCATITSWTGLRSQQWNTLVIMYDLISVHLSINDQVATNITSCMVNPNPTNNELEMKIGSRSLEEEGFKGRIRCLGMFKFTAPSSVLIDAITTTCTSSDVLNIRVQGIGVPRNMKITNLQIVSTQVAPPPSLAVINRFGCRSLTTCGQLCAQVSYCKSFTFSKDKMCSLYDVFLLNQLLFNDGNSYYRLTNTV